MVYPRSWLMDRLKGKLLTLYEGGPLPSNTQNRLEQLSVEELLALQDDPARSVELLDPGETSTQRDTSIPLELPELEAPVLELPTFVGGVPAGSSEGMDEEWAGGYL